VQDVSRNVKGEALLQLIERGEVLLLPGLRQFVERRIRALDIRGVMFAVMQLENPARVVRLERRMVIRKIGKRVAFQCESPSLCHG
jgi:hypothetical protein